MNRVFFNTIIIKAQRQLASASNPTDDLGQLLNKIIDRNDALELENAKLRDPILKLTNKYRSLL